MITAVVTGIELVYEAISHTKHPELFEPKCRHNGAPWPIEPHNRPVIPESWWEIGRIVERADGLLLPAFAQNLIDCENHPGFIVRRVRLAMLSCEGKEVINTNSGGWNEHL